MSLTKLSVKVQGSSESQCMNQLLTLRHKSTKIQNPKVNLMMRSKRGCLPVGERPPG